MNNAYLTPSKSCNLKKYYSLILEYPKNILLIVLIINMVENVSLRKALEVQVSKFGTLLENNSKILIKLKC